MNMYSCSEHDGINGCIVVYDSKNCPMCEANDRISDLEAELETLNNNSNKLIDQLKDEITSLKDELSIRLDC